jgi:chromosome segregation ATPase
MSGWQSEINSEIFRKLETMLARLDRAEENIKELTEQELANKKGLEELAKRVFKAESKIKEYDYLFQCIADNHQEVLERLTAIEKTIPPFILGAQFTPCREADRWDEEDGIIWQDMLPEKESE